MRYKQAFGSAVLLLAALIWGTTFVSQKSAADALLGPFTFNGIRFMLGCVVLLPLVLWQARRKPAEKPSVPAATQWRYGAVCGALVFVATNLQQFGLAQTSAGKSGFVTALYVVLVPVFGALLFGKRTGWNVWAAVVLAAGGLYLLCVQNGFSVQLGDVLTFGCALVFAFQILTVDKASAFISGVWLSFMQFLTAGLLSLVCMALFEQPRWDVIAASAGQLIYAGVFSCGVAYTLQIVGQKHTDPTVASLLMSFEAVFAVLSGWLLLHEQLSAREWIGCAVMLVAIVFAQLPLSSLPGKAESTLPDINNEENRV